MKPIRSLLSVAGVVATCLLAQVADARQALQTTIKKLEVEYKDGGGKKVIVHVTSNVTPTSGCATQSPSFDNAFAFDTDTAPGKTALTLLSAAFLGGRVVDIAGTGSCINVNLGGVNRSVEELSFYSVN